MMASLTEKTVQSKPNKCLVNMDVDHSDINIDSLLPGVSLGPCVCFKDSCKNVSVLPILVDFRRIIQAKSDVPVVSGVSYIL